MDDDQSDVKVGRTHPDTVSTDGIDRYFLIFERFSVSERGVNSLGFFRISFAMPCRRLMAEGPCG